MHTELLESDGFDWRKIEWMAICLIAGLVIGWIFGALGGPTEDYTVIESGEVHVTAQYDSNNETMLEVFRPGTIGYVICRKEDTIVNDSVDRIEAWGCSTYPDKTHPLMRESENRTR